MVAALAQLHEDVEQLHLGQPPHTVHHINVLQQNLGVPAEDIRNSTMNYDALCTYVAVKYYPIVYFERITKFDVLKAGLISDM